MAYNALKWKTIYWTFEMNTCYYESWTSYWENYVIHV